MNQNESKFTATFEIAKPSSSTEVERFKELIKDIEVDTSITPKINDISPYGIDRIDQHNMGNNNNNNYLRIFLNTRLNVNGEASSMEAMVYVTKGEDGYFIAECPALPGCFSQGETKQEALKNIKEALELCWETRKEEGFPLPEIIKFGD